MPHPAPISATSPAVALSAINKEPSTGGGGVWVTAGEVQSDGRRQAAEEEAAMSTTLPCEFYVFGSFVADDKARRQRTLGYGRIMEEKFKYQGYWAFKTFGPSVVRSTNSTGWCWQNNSSDLVARRDAVRPVHSRARLGSQHTQTYTNTIHTQTHLVRNKKNIKHKKNIKKIYDFVQIVVLNKRQKQEAARRVRQFACVR